MSTDGSAVPNDNEMMDWMSKIGGRLKILSNFFYIVAVGGFGLGVWVTTMQLGISQLRTEMDARISEEKETQERRVVLEKTLTTLETNSNNQTKALSDLTLKLDRWMERGK